MAFKFSENETVADISVVPQEFQAHYTEADVDGKKVFTISDASRPLVNAYEGVSSALSKAQSDKKQASDESARRRNALKEYDSIYDNLGLSDDDRTADGILGQINELMDQVKGGKEVKINLDKINSENAKRMEELAAAKDEKYNKLQASLVKHMVTEAATASIAKEKGSVELLLPIVAGQCKVVEDADGYTVRVVDSQGDVRSDGLGGMMGIDGLIKELKGSNVYARAFDSETPSGSGATPGASNPPMSAQRYSQSKDVSSTDKIAQGLAKRSRG